MSLSDGSLTSRSFTIPLAVVIQTIQPDECKSYFANAGYASIKT